MKNYEYFVYCRQNYKLFMKQPNLIDILSETEGKFIQVSHVYNDHAPGFNDHVPGLSKL